MQLAIVDELNGGGYLNGRVHERIFGSGEIMYCECDRGADIEWYDIGVDQYGTFYHRFPNCGRDLRPTFAELITKFTKDLFDMDRPPHYRYHSEEQSEWLPD
jgi:hypothetical protein